MNSLADLHREAKSYYNELSEEEKAAMWESFGDFDQDGDEYVTRKELALAVSDKDRRQIMSYFDILDIDCNGVLDFDEMITLFYLFKVPGKICFRCHGIVTGKSCTKCSRSHSHPKKPFNFNNKAAVTRKTGFNYL